MYWKHSFSASKFHTLSAVTELLANLREPAERNGYCISRSVLLVWLVSIPQALPTHGLVKECDAWDYKGGAFKLPNVGLKPRYSGGTVGLPNGVRSNRRFRGWLGQKPDK